MSENVGSIKIAIQNYVAPAALRAMEHQYYGLESSARQRTCAVLSGHRDRERGQQAAHGRGHRRIQRRVLAYLRINNALYRSILNSILRNSLVPTPKTFILLLFMMLYAFEIPTRTLV